MTEQTPKPEQKSPWAPPEGWEPQERPVASEDQTSAAVPAEAGKVHTIPADQFKGNPSRVLGHPSNPATEILKAVGDAKGPEAVQAIDQSTPPAPAA